MAGLSEVHAGPAMPSFGELLRRHREAAALSQEELAERAGLSTIAISQLERGQRRTPQPRTVRLLAEALALQGEARGAFVSAAIPVSAETEPARQTVPPGARRVGGDGTSPTVPVALTPFIGRAREVEAVRTRLLAPETRLLTLAGPGGVGKTRLALQVAAITGAAFPDGTYIVALGALVEASLVPSAIAQALGGAEEPQRSVQDIVKDLLREKTSLLVLDNLEQVLTAGPFLVDLLAACEGLKVLVTSRTALRVQGERIYPVPPLSMPARHEPLTPEQLAQCDATRLFIARAQDVAPDFVVTAETAPVLAEICARLDGLPLAIELAAARVRVLPPQALLARLSSRLKLLTGGARDRPARQRTLRDTIDWSYNLLEPGEQRLFARLAVFAGGCTLSATEAICDAEGDLPFDILDGIESLIVKNLLQREEVDGQAEEPAEPRFVLLETLQEYAREQVDAWGEATRLRRWHAGYYLALAEEAQSALRGPEQERWLACLEAEHDNVRAALRWAEEAGEVESGLRLAGALAPFWLMRGHLSEGRAWLEGLLARQALPASGPAVRAKALRGAGALAHAQGDYARATDVLTEGLHLYQQAGDQEGIAFSLNALGMVAYEQGDYARAVPLYEESLAMRQALGDVWGIAASRNNLGNVAWQQGDYARAAALHAENLSLFRELGDKRAIAASLNNLANVASEQGEYARAAPLLEESLALLRELGDKEGLAASLNNLANVAREQGDHARATALYTKTLDLLRTVGSKFILAECLEGLAMTLEAQQPGLAAQLFGAAATLRSTMGVLVPLADSARRERAVAAIRADLGEAAFVATWAAGHSMTPEQAITYGLQTAEPAAPPAEEGQA